MLRPPALHNCRDVLGRAGRLELARATTHRAAAQLDRDRRRQPQDRRHRGSDQPADAAGDGRPRGELEGDLLPPSANLVISIKPSAVISERWALSNAANFNQSRLNIPDLPVGGFAAAPAAAPAAAAAEPEDEAPPAAEKTLFTVKLTAFDAAAKPKIIKEVKSLLGLSLVDSKKFVESAPKVMKESVPKEEAEKILATMKELGATVVME